MAIAAPDLKRQVQPQTTVTPPEYKPFEGVAGEKRKGIDWTNAKNIEDWLNNLKPGFYKYLADKQFESATSNIRLNEHLYNYLTMYQGEIVGYYLSEGAMEMLFSALGPIGNLWRSGYNKKISWKMAWMMNPLNPDSVYFYLKSLPERQAFKIAMLPIQGAMAVLARGGGPFTLSTYQDHYGRTRQEYIFTPLLRATQAAHIAADGIDKLAGFSSNTFNTDHDYWDSDNSPWKQDMNKTNKNFHEALENLKAAKLTRDKTAIKTADQKLKFLLDKYDGWYHEDSSLSTARKTVFAGAGVSRALLKHLYSNTARRLRSTERDPISYFLSLIGGAIWDLTLGLALNIAKTAATQAINLIPGARVLRAQFTEFITGNKFLSNASIGGSSLKSIIQGVFTPATASFGYTGYRALSALFPNASISQIYNPFTNSIINLAIPLNPAGIMGSAVVGSAGIFYNVALKMAASTNYYWTSQYQSYLKASTFKGGWAIDEGAMGNKLIPENYYKGFKPGPISNFAKFLAEHPFFRIPINGFVIADLGVNLLGWNPWIAYPSAMAADYFLQTRHAWGKLLTQDTWKIFGKIRFTPYYHAFSLNNPSSPGSWVYRRYLSIYYQNPWNFKPATGLTGLTERPWFTGFKKFFSPAQPYIRNFFNPGFLMGFGWISYLTPTLGGWAYLAGPVLGSATWLGVSRMAQALAGAGPGFISQFNQWGWMGTTIGFALDFLIPGNQAWLPTALGIGFPIVGSILTLFGTSFTALASSAISSVVGAFAGAAAGAAVAAQAMAIWATAMSVALVAGLTIFFAYTIYAGFWVPMIEEGKAQPTSTNFSISTKCALTAPNQYNCCSNFSLTENIFNSRNFLDHNTDFSRTNLTVDLNDPAITTDAFRGKQLDYKTYVTEWADGNNYSLVIPPGNMINDVNSIPYLDAFLPTPSDQTENLFTLMQTNSSVVFSMQPIFDILQKMAEEFGKTKYLLLEYKAQITLMEHQKTLLEKLINQLETNLTSSNLVFSLTQTLASLEAAAAANPLTDPCPNDNPPCTPEQQGLKDLYNSWPIIVQQYSSSIKGLLAQAQSPTADPIAIKASIQTYLDTLIDLPEQIDTQITNLNDIKDQIEKTQGKMNAADAAVIPNTNFLNFANMVPDGPEQLAVWALLEKYFPDIFKKSKTFYFIPQGTNYQVCVDTQYTGPTPATPQTVCSTISYTPSVWGPNTAFAKSCTTFTPQ